MKNIEIDLLNMNIKDAAMHPKQYTKLLDEGNHQRSYKSHFSDLLRYTRDSKFTQYWSFLDKFFYFDAYKAILEHKKTKKNLAVDDLPSPYYQYNPEIYLEKFDRYWNFEVKNKENPSIAKAVFKTFKWDLFMSFISILTNIILKFFYMYQMGNIINFITQRNITTHDDNGINNHENNVYFGINQRYMILYQTLAMIISMFCSSILSHYIYFRNYTLGNMLRLASISMIYKKIHTISLNSLNQLNVGKVINLAANDFNELSYSFTFFTPMLLSPVIIIGASCMLWNYFGVISLSGIMILTLIIPLQYLFTGLTKPYKSQKNNATDERIRLTNEIIECIRLIKMYAWELPIQYAVKKLRSKELGFIKKMFLYDAIGRIIINNSVYITSFMLFLTYVIVGGGDLSPQKVYTTITILGFVKQQGLLFFLLGRSHFINMMLNFNRLKEILLIPDILSVEETNFIAKIYKDDMESHENLLSVSTSESIPSIPDENLENKCEISVIMENFTGFWNHILDKPCLKDINLQVKPNTLVAVLGKIGSGKTSFLLNFLRELPKTQGKFECHGRIAYVEQEPYVFEGTLKDNILFGNMLDQSFYDHVLEITSLKDDLISLPNQDDTLIGEKGVTLSGGQRARVSLARAIYSQSDIYLLDDPLSAVDAKVAKIIFNKAIKEYLCKDRIVFLVTHHIHFAKEADHIILLNNGQIESQGSYSEIIQKNIDFMSIFPTEKEINDQTATNDDHSNGENDSIKPIDLSDKKETSLKVVKPKMFELEDKENILVTNQTYLKYIKNSGGFRLFTLLIMIFIIHEILNLAYNRYIGYWALLHENFHNSNKGITTGINDDIQIQNYYYIKIIGIFLVLSICLASIKNLSLNYMNQLSSENLHNQLLNQILKAKIRFFDLNPIGRILNRFSGDLGILDLVIFRVIYDSIDGIIFSGLLILTISYTNIYILPFALIILRGINKCKNHFEGFLLEARKLDLITKSPLISQISSTINGLIVIRAYNQGARFITTFLENIYNGNKAGILYIRSIRSFGICLDLLIQLFSSLSITFFVIYSLVYNVESGLFGMILLYLIQIAERFEWTIRQITMLNTQMTSTQRIIEYDNIPIENYNSTSNKLSKAMPNKLTWPSSGDIEFNNVYMKYDESNDIFALKGLTFNIQSGERIGCIGRTGAGKSSIIQALFKMVEIETKPESFIKIDGENIKDVDLHLLRSNLAIIPQNAVIFNGSIRRNLDPLNIYTDELIWKALEDVNLKEMVMNLEKKLDTDMTISNSVFSVGQKQLICLARIILRQSKIIILDEATANVDLATDNFIQEKIKELFKNCTMLTIAHRLTTIADYDKVLVMDQGKAIEYDHPYKLLVKNIGDNTITNIDSVFTKMVLNVGLIMSNTIFKTAKQAYFEKYYSKFVTSEMNLALY